MSVTHRDYIFEDLQTRYDFVRDLPLSTVYSLFYSNKIYEELRDSHCNSLPTGINSDICDHRSFCISFQNALRDLYGMILTKYLDNNSKWCEYLSYCIHTNILNSKSCKHNEQLYRQIDEIIRDYHTVHNNCNIQKFTIGREDFIKKKKLYLLGEILFWIKNKYEYSDYLNKYSYDTFFGECSSLYGQIISTDKCNIKEAYRKEFINLVNTFNSTKEYLIGKHKSIPHDDLDLPKETLCQQAVKGIKTGSELPEKIKAAQEKPEEDEALEKKTVESTGPKGEGLVAGVSLSDARVTEGSLYTEPAATLSDIQIEVEAMDGESSDENTSNTLGTIVGTSLGFVLPLITMYRFTPLGTWINTKILGRNNIMKNIKNNNQDFLLNSSENREMELGDTMYRVAYNSVTK
ncbi:PIR protein [Plasmodium vivax]|uniref:VIR protein n=1 Tax=Plasmodium vivax TaxID=5855 RepID=A0A565A680_PLAVI|nr:PIR protein [Plasmodium vivax]